MLSRQQQAAVIYFAIPKEDRPMGLDEFADQVAGVSVRQLSNWKQLEEFRDAVKAARAQYRQRSGDLYQQAARAQALMILMKGMKKSDLDDQLKAAKSVLKEVKDVSNATDTVSYRAYSDPQLISEMMSRGFSIPKADMQKFQDLVGLEDLT